MPTLMEERAAALAKATAIVHGAKAADRELSDDEQTKVKSFFTVVEGLDQRIKSAQEDQNLLARLGELTPEAKAAGGDGNGHGDTQARTLGEHFMKHAGARLKEIRGIKGASVGAPEFKAASDTQVTNGGAFSPVLTQVDRTIVQGLRTRLTVADLLGSGTLSGNAISYFVEGALEGAFTTVAEGAAKPQLHVVDPTTVTDALKKIAGFIKFTDEMTEDLDFYVSEINGRLLFELAKFEEAQLLAGNGTGTNILGLLNRSGIQTETGASAADNPDSVFRAITKVGTGAQLDADGVIIHPTDYQNFRLRKDSNGQYYGGGFFSGEYNVGTLTMQPPLWGLRTVVTPAISSGTVLVGAFQQAATVYRKGGVRVESTNSHASDFTSNLVTVRAEERIALAVRRPAGLVKLTLGSWA